MITLQEQQTILTLHQSGQTIREISRTLKISRNTVRRVLRKHPPDQEHETQEKHENQEIDEKQVKDGEHKDLTLIRRLFKDCRGNAQRIHEILTEEHERKIGYSTLTRVVREGHLRKPKERVGQWHFQPGEEMQHDTSPHRVTLGEKTVTAQCAALVLGYSRLVYIQYYPCYTRFEARCFLQKAIIFMGGACGRCVIDNSSVILAAGSGEDAVIAPEMVALAGAYGFGFMAHRILNPQRKGIVERTFHWVERNFLPGRAFQDWDDLNQAAISWCVERANRKEKRVLGMSPEAAHVMERPHLQPLPRHTPPIYVPLPRIVGDHGYVLVDTNRYSVPDKLVGKQVEVHKYLERIHVYFQGRMVADHARLIGQRQGTQTKPGHHKPLGQTRKNRMSVCEEEQLLRGRHNDELNRYLDGFKQRVKGRGQYYFRRLLNLQRTYPASAFQAALAKALYYGMYDLARLEKLILQSIAGDFFNFD